ncbi:hypothetical protein NB704_001242 [Pantoea ananatis]|nr:hypothetical protein [Pantoea ananatis]
MRSHAFADMMYVLYQSFGLFVKNDKHRETRNNSGFSFHQAFASHCYDSVSDIVDTNGGFSREQRREIFARYEQLYNALMHIPVFSRLDNNQIVRRYLQEALPPVFALELIKASNPEDEKHFYYHIHQFLISRHCPSSEGDSGDVYAGVRHYLREYINSLDFCYDDHLTHIQTYISNIRVGIRQQKGTIKQNITLCRSEYIESELLDKDVAANEDRLDKIENAYLSLNLLLEFEWHTSSVISLASHYREVNRNGIRYDSIHDKLHCYLYSHEYDDEILHEITLYWYKKAIWPVSVTVKEEPYRYIICLRKIVFNIGGKGRFSGWDFIRMSACLNSSDPADVLSPYAKLMTLICLLSQEDLAGAWALVNDVDIEKLPVGFLPSAFSVIQLALKIKLERRKIREGVMLSMVNRVLANQGVFADYHVVTEQGDISPLASSANNLVIMRTVKMYNRMIRKISYLHEDGPCETYPHEISGLLQKVDGALGKINRLIEKEGDVIDSDTLAAFIVADKVLTAEEVSGSLIGILSKSTLYNCVLSLNDLMQYLRCRGDDISNIILLAGNSVQSRYERKRVCEALKLVSERLL